MSNLLMLSVLSYVTGGNKKDVLTEEEDNEPPYILDIVGPTDITAPGSYVLTLTVTYHDPR